MRAYMTVLAVLGMGLASLAGDPARSVEARNSVTAIDIALEPDATMVAHALAANARLLKVFPKGFTLDATHHPHISMLQRYVRTADLDKVYQAVGGVLADKSPGSWRLKAFKYYYIPWKDLGLAGIVVLPSEDLLGLQRELIDAVTPFTTETGTAAAYVTTPEHPEINEPTIEYVATFVPKASGKSFNPHVTVGLARRTTSRRCSPSRSRCSRSRRWAHPSTSSAISEPPGRSCPPGTSSIDDGICPGSARIRWPARSERSPRCSWTRPKGATGR